MPEPSRDTDAEHRLFCPEDGISPPFTVINRAGLVLIALEPRAIHDPFMADDRAHVWLTGVRGRVIVDLARIPMIDSICCTWLIHIAQVAHPATVAVHGANPRVAETLRILGMKTLLQISDAELP